MLQANSEFQIKSIAHKREKEKNFFEAKDKKHQTTLRQKTRTHTTSKHHGKAHNHYIEIADK